MTNIRTCYLIHFLHLQQLGRIRGIIVGLELSLHVRASWVTLCRDSQLVVNQINNEYEAKEEQLINYLASEEQLIIL